MINTVTPFLKAECNKKQPVVKVGGPDNLGPHILKSWGDASHGSHRVVAPMSTVYKFLAD